MDAAGNIVSVSVSSKPVEVAAEGEKQAKNLLTICAYCKKIANGSGMWEQLEAYFAKRFNLSFSHGICPPCAEEAYKQLEPLKTVS